MAARKTPQTPVITRIDMAISQDGLRVMKYPDGWSIESQPIENYVNAAWSIDDAIAWLQKNGWTVRRWYYGARAFKGTLYPIRNTAQIKRKRKELMEHPDPKIQWHAVDLAFDL